MEEKRSQKVQKVIVWSDGMGAQFRSRFVFTLLSGFDTTMFLEWHYMEAHHGKGPMDGVGVTIKNVVFREVKSGRLSVNTPEQFAAAAARLVPSIASIYLPTEEMLIEPAEMSNDPAIPETLKIHKVKRNINEQNIPYLEFFKLSSDEIPHFTQYYRKDSDPFVCGHHNSDIDENTCGHCLSKYGGNDTEEWLCCPICKLWFHENCFHL